MSSIQQASILQQARVMSQQKNARTRSFQNSKVITNKASSRIALDTNGEEYKNEVIKNYIQAHSILKTLEQTQNEI